MESLKNELMIEGFLSFLANDCVNYSPIVKPLSVGYVERLQSLVEGVDVDLTLPLSVDDE